jgi:4-nitrophenyl phosphatase
VNRIRAFFLDLDGTLYNGNVKIDGASQWIQFLRDKNYPFLFLTNNSSRTPEMVARHLNELGIEAHPDEVYNSAQATAQYVKDQVVSGARVYCVGEIGMQTALREIDVKFAERDVQFVVQGIDRALTYDKLKLAVQLILSGATFVMTNPDLLLPWNEQLVPGAGSIGAMLQAATGKQPVVIGKPSAIIMEYAKRRLEQLKGTTLSFSEICMVGDNLRTDIAAAAAVGCCSALTLTGLLKPGEEAEYVAKSAAKPDFIFANLYELKEAFA